MGGACGRQGENRNAYSVVVEKHTKRDALGRPKRRWDTIKFILTG